MSNERCLKLLVVILLIIQILVLRYESFSSLLVFSKVMKLINFNIENASDVELVSEIDENQIREWGCNRTETPFIFVHVGKAGGGTIRSAIAFGARNVTKTKFYLKDDSFYPIDGNGTHAYFVNSDRAKPVPFLEEKFEAVMPCEATTPLGLIGCRDTNRYMKGCNSFKDNSCRHVYVGHNYIGNEMTWLTRNELEQWYNEYQEDTNSEQNSSTLFEFIDEILKSNNQKTYHRVKKIREYKQIFHEAVQPISLALDEKAHELVSEEDFLKNGWSSLYQSLSVLRVVMIREPFSWLSTKFFWHKLEGKCDDDFDISWAHDFAIDYIWYLCGDDCKIAYTIGLKTVDEMEKQAAANLRRSFAVVGILDDIDNFFEMINARVKYIDIELDAVVSKHRSKNPVGEKLRCKERFKDPLLQEKFISSSPAIAALVRLYDIGMEVNKFQKEELEKCNINYTS